MMKGGGPRLARHEGKYYDQSVRGKVERRSEGKSERRRTRTYNALFLVAARFKGKRTLLDISIRGEHAVSRKGASRRDRERDTGGVSRGRGSGFS